MSGFLIDTNVISELMRARPNPQVCVFFADLEDAWLSVITLHELTYGIERLPQGQKRSALESAMSALVSQYEDRILPIGAGEAHHSALMRSKANAQGHNVHMADALIAATARVHGLTVVTRNISDFSGLGVDLIDPWSRGEG